MQKERKKNHVDSVLICGTSSRLKFNFAFMFKASGCCGSDNVIYLLTRGANWLFQREHKLVDHKANWIRSVHIRALIAAGCNDNSGRCPKCYFGANELYKHVWTKIKKNNKNEKQNSLGGFKKKKYKAKQNKQKSKMLPNSKVGNAEVVFCHWR